MKIEYTISECNCGENTTADNQRYASAVKAEITKSFPDADVDVRLSSRQDFSECLVDGFDNDDDVTDSVRFIANEVWNKADY